MIRVLLANKRYAQEQNRKDMPNRNEAIDTINRLLHKELTSVGIPRRLDGSKLGLRKRLDMLDELGEF